MSGASLRRGRFDLLHEHVGESNIHARVGSQNLIRRNIDIRWMFTRQKSNVRHSYEFIELCLVLTFNDEENPLWTLQNSVSLENSSTSNKSTLVNKRGRLFFNESFLRKTTFRTSNLHFFFAHTGRNTGGSV